MAGKFRINGQTITQKQDGTWLGPDGNKMSNESVYRIFGNKTIKQDPKTGKLNFDWDQYNNRTSEEKRRQLDHEMEFSDGAYDAKGNPRTRDYKKRPRTKYDDIEDEMGGMMDEFRGKGFWQPSPLFVPPVQALQGMSGRPRWEDIQQSRETLERDRSLFNKISPFNVQRSTIPELEEVERSGQMYRGSGFKPEHYRGEESYSTPIDQMSPPAYQPDRRQPSYNGESSGLRQLSPQEIDYMNSKVSNPPARIELERTVPRNRNIWDYLNSLKRNVQ